MAVFRPITIFDSADVAIVTNIGAEILETTAFAEDFDGFMADEVDSRIRIRGNPDLNDMVSDFYRYELDGNKYNIRDKTISSDRFRIELTGRFVR